MKRSIAIVTLLLINIGIIYAIRCFSGFEDAVVIGLGLILGNIQVIQIDNYNNNKQQ